ncbi:MAG: ABC transporter permease [Clostridia bacterium]|nr:ABC transporter permease [Clostridia bacterium]
MKISMIFSGVFRMLKKHKWLSFLMIVQCLFCILLLNMIFGMITKTEKVIDKYSKFTGDRFVYKVVNNDEDWDKYFEDKNEDYSKLKRFVESLEKREDLDFVITDDQSVIIFAPGLPNKFNFQYEFNNPSFANQDHKDEKEVKALHVSENFFREFGINLSEGEFFKKEDFYHKEGDYVPVILGHEYKNIFSIGQIIDGKHLYEKFQFKVIGFLPEFTDIPWSDLVAGRFTSADRYILIPAFTYSSESNDAYRYNQVNLMLYSSGRIISKLNFLDVKGIVENLRLKSGTNEEYIVYLDSDDISQKLTMMSKKDLSNLIYIFVILTIFTIVSMSLTINGFIKDSYYEYGVHMVSGASPENLVFQVIGFTLLIVGVPCLFSFLLTPIVLLYVPFLEFFVETIMPVTVMPMVSLVFSFLVFVISSIVPLITLKKVDVINLVRRAQ